MICDKDDARFERVSETLQ